MAGFEFKVTKKIAVIGGDEANGKELNIVKWGELEPRYDIRNWRNGSPMKGISLTKEEAIALRDALTEELK